MSDLSSFEHLQHIDLSKNDVRDVNMIVALPHLITLNASSNQIKSMEIFAEATDSQLQFLQVRYYII